jgi:hypothetical protein
MSTIDEIEKIVDERVKDAKRKQIWEKALKVIYVCGKETLYSKLFGYFVKNIQIITYRLSLTVLVNL